MKDMTPETQGEAPKSHICFFWKKQMPLADDIHDSRNTRIGPMEWHLLFPEKANATHRWQIWLHKHIERPPRVTFAFSGKSKCHSQMTDTSPETPAEAPGVAFAFSGKIKCHSKMTDMTPETLAEATRSHIWWVTFDESRNTTRGPQESHLLFPEKANATHRWQIWLQKH